MMAAGKLYGRRERCNIRQLLDFSTHDQTSTGYKLEPL